MDKIKNFKSWNRWTFRSVLLAFFTGILIVTVFAVPQPALAHCDSVQGPVVQAAQRALDKGNIKLILPYVQPADEAELTAAFEHTLAVRKLGGEAKKLSDTYFFETAVRLHRQGEGASYEGLKDEAVPPAIQAADEAMKTGNIDEVVEMLNQEIEHGLSEKYNDVVDARANAKKFGTVEALREQAEAELIFEKYVFELYSAAAAAEVHAEGSAHNH